MKTTPPIVEEEIFQVVAALPPPERAGYLDAACGEDPALRARLERLLGSHDQSGFMQPSAESLSPEVEAELARLKPEEAGDRIGHYKLLQEIGEGGFGTVWMAEQIEPVSRRVALKIIKLGMDTREVIGRFEQERQALAMMDHPNIAKVHDAGATQYGRPFFVMELVKGIPITQYCDEAGLGTRERLVLFGDVCSAIQHAHQKGIIHRDIKPSNVMVTLYADQPVVKVIDFGIAKATQSKLTDKTLFTRFEQFIGTPVYMSPEQAALSAVDIDTRSDIYALGILLYELLTGKPPFDAQTLASAGYDEMRRIIREVEPVKPSSRLGTIVGEERTLLAKAHRIEPEKLGRLVEPDLDWIVMKAIDKDRTRRYETANAFAQDITRYLGDEPVSATPPSAGYQFRKFARRNQAALRVAAAIAAVLVAATLVSTWQAVRATRAERKIAETLTQVAAERDAKEVARRAATDAENLAKGRLAEVAAERDAKETARQDAEAISTFLTEVFQSPDPTRDGRTITVAETLEKAAMKLDTDLATQPDRRAKLQATLGQTYFALGLARQALPLQEKVRDYYLTNHGPEHPDTLLAMHRLANSYDEADHQDEALKLREEVLALFRKVNGPEHRHTLLAMGNLANSYTYAGRRDEALKLVEEVLALRRKVLGPEHPETLGAMNNLALSYSGAGRRDEALKLREEVLALRRKVLGLEHPDTLVAMGNLAISYFDAERRDEALKLREEALGLFRKVNGPEHPNTLKAMNFLANSYDAAGRKDEALKMQEEALALYRKVNGPRHADTHTAMNNLAASYDAAGRKDEALSLLAEASSRKPDDTILAMKVAALQVWFGRIADHAATSQRMLTWAADTASPEVAERVSKLASIRPEADAPRREAALVLARKAVDLGKENMPWYQMAHGMAEYRSGHHAEAVEALTHAEAAAPSLANELSCARILGTAGFYRAMSLFHQGKPAEARALFAATEAKMKPLPADDQNPLAGGADHDDLILWLACKEAKALLAEPGATGK